jgi:hypothetical protein
MKTIHLLALILATNTLADLYGAPTDLVVATNLTDAQVDTNAWEEIGLIAPAYNNYNNRSVGQSFNPQSSGILTTVDALIAAGRFSPVPGSPPLNVSIYTSAAGIPIASLGTLTFPASDFSPLLTSASNRETFDFSQFQIVLETAQEYLIAFETPFGINGRSGSDSPFLAGWSPTSLDGDHSLSLGENLSSATNGSDWQLSSYYKELGIVVRATPEPGSGCLLLVGIGLMNASRYDRRRRKSVPHNRV